MHAIRADEYEGDNEGDNEGDEDYILDLRARLRLFRPADMSGWDDSHPEHLMHLQAHCLTFFEQQLKQV